MPAGHERRDRSALTVISVVHVCTGLLFLLLNAFIYYALLPAHWQFAIVYDPFFAFCCWGWYAEARAIWQGHGLLS